MTGQIHNAKKALGYDFYIASVLEDGRLALGRLKFDCVHEGGSVGECERWLREQGISEITFKR